MTIPKYEKLYTLKSTGKIYEWSIEIIKNTDNSYTIKTLHGEKNGKLVPHSKKILKGKVKRTVLEQAILEANSKWKKKHDKDGYRTKISEINKKSKLVVRPMLASKFTFESLKKKSRAKNIVLPCYVQRKYDGIRCLVYLNNTKDVIMETRTGVLIENFNNMRIELKKILLKMPDKFYLDGELFTNDIAFEHINGLVRKQADKTTPAELSLINKINYMIFDCFDLNNIDLSFVKRYDIIKNIFKSKFNYLYKANIYLASTEKDIKTYHSKFMNDGMEGTILRNIDAPYELKKEANIYKNIKTSKMKNLK